MLELTMHRDIKWDRDELVIALQSLADPCDTWRIIKDNSRYLIARHGEFSLFYKDFAPDHSLAGLIKSALGQGPVARSLRGARLLKAARLLAPEVVASGVREGRPFILMTELAGPQLHNALRSFLTHPRGERLRFKRRLLWLLGETIGRLHGSGLVHGDLRPNNLILHVDESGLLGVGLIDNERSRKPLRFRREQLRNLTQLMLLNRDDVTRTDRARFFQGYFAAFPHSAAARRRLLAEVTAAVEARFARGSRPLGTLIEAHWWDYLAGARFPDPQ